MEGAGVGGAGGGDLAPRRDCGAGGGGCRLGAALARSAGFMIGETFRLVEC